ncbi:MAG: carbohydrate kinase family protein [Chloroflexota bacterium]
MALKVVGYGIMVDDIVFPDGKTRMGLLGGGGPQTAWGAAAATGDGTQAGLVAGVGNDLDAVDMRPLHNANINMDGIRQTQHPTPRAWQVLEWSGLRRHVWRVPVDTLDEQLARGYDVLPASYHDAAYFHWGIDPGNTTPDQNWTTGLITQGGKVSIEPYQPPPQPLSPEALKELVSPLALFTANQTEAEGITGKTDNTDIIRAFREAGCDYLALRNGSLGSLVVDINSGEAVHVPAVPTDVVDVVGAGNAFNGALLITLEQGIAEAACYASAAASYMIEQVGMPLHLPDRDDFMRRVNFARERREITRYD